MSNVNETQIGGRHYKTQYQHWDFVRHCLGNRYLEGCVTKYVARHRKKNGVEDLKKALHYLDKIIELFAGEQYESMVYRDPLPQFRPSEFIRLNQLSDREAFVVQGMVYWSNVHVLYRIHDELKSLLSDEEAGERHRQAIKAGAGSTLVNDTINTFAKLNNQQAGVELRMSNGEVVDASVVSYIDDPGKIVGVSAGETVDITPEEWKMRDGVHDEAEPGRGYLDQDRPDQGSSPRGPGAKAS